MQAVIKYLGLKKKDLEEYAEVSLGYINERHRNDKPVNTYVLEKFFEYVDKHTLESKLNAHWLITGEGNMFVDKYQLSEINLGVKESDEAYEIKNIKRQFLNALQDKNFKEKVMVLLEL